MERKRYARRRQLVNFVKFRHVVHYTFESVLDLDVALKHVQKLLFEDATIALAMEHNHGAFLEPRPSCRSWRAWSTAYAIGGLALNRGAGRSFRPTSFRTPCSSTVADGGLRVRSAACELGLFPPNATP